ncbi:hypothetical protein WA026_014429 [Henosepilachna vigintioctopunctata]|uniref:C2 domain-containing protein n=1 Tax=Henosepilachna vigintioctopunctata TaxID=420089 RepID=A0AAW1UJ21_9CUCU
MKINMLKWSVTSRRNQDKSDVERPQRSEYSSDINSFTPRTRNKRRHSGTNRGRISLPSRKSLGSEQDKENQFTSTPIKSLEDLNLFDPFRDVSNLTPKDRIESRGLNSNVNRRASMGNVPNIKDAQLTPLRSAKKTKKRKSFLTPFRDQNVDKYANQSSQFFKHFETVDSHIGALPELSNCDCDKNTINVPRKTNQKRFPDIYAPTLPTFTIDYSPTSMKTTHCLLTLNKTSPSRATPLTGFLEGANEDTPCFKKPKIDHVNDFLHQITFLTSPEESAVAFDFNIPKRRNSVKISPLVKRFVDLRFSNEKNKKENRKGINDSSFINDLSLNQIVDAILDETDENYSDLHIGDEHIMSTKENELNETHEENIMNSEFEKRTLVPVSINRCSPDSGFKSSVATENCHQLEGNFQCKCNNNNNSTGSISIGKTFINLDETYNERCVDGTINRKRPSEDLGAYEMETKRLNLDESSFALKRQKCVRRRKTIFKMNRNHNINIRENEDCNMVSINQTQTNLQHENFPLNDNSFESSIVSASDVGRLTDVVCENFVEKKNESETSENVTPTSGKGRIRRCLLFESPDSKIPFRSVTPLRSSTTDEGLIQLRIKQVDGELTVHVIRAWNLSKHSQKLVNSYVKVYLSNQSGAISGNGETSQRTAVLADSSKPIFNHVFKLKDHNKHERLHIDVWHRDGTTR